MRSFHNPAPAPLFLLDVADEWLCHAGAMRSERAACLHLHALSQRSYLTGVGEQLLHTWSIARGAAPVAQRSGPAGPRSASLGPAGVPELPSQIKARLAADRLEARLRTHNTQTYQAELAKHAHAVGYSGSYPRPKQLDSRVQERIAQDARTSARGIVQTQQERRAALVAQAGSKSAAKPLFAQWAQDVQAPRVAHYEARRTAAQAASDFYERNAGVLEGEEWVTPDTSSGDEACEGAIADGRQPLGSIDPPPYHPHCVHVLQRAYAPVADPDALWVGREQDDDDEKGLGAMLDYTGAQLELKTVDTQQRIIAGYAAYHSNVDRVQDIIDPSASRKAVGRLSSPSDVGVFIGHNSSLLPIGIPQKIEATPQGLYTETYILKGPEGDNLLAVAKDLAAHGQSLGMSIGYRMLDSKPERVGGSGKMVRRLLDYDLKEFSYAAAQTIANPMALVGSIKTALAALSLNPDDQRGFATMGAPSTFASPVFGPDPGDEDGDGDDDDDDDEAGAPADPGPRLAPCAKAEWSTSYVNDLDNDAFLWVEDGEDDDDGKRVPRSKRHFPYKDASGAIDIPHLKNAIARIPQSNLPDDLKARLQARARRLLENAQSSDGDGKTAEEGPAWEGGAPILLKGLSFRLSDVAQAAAEEYKAMERLGEETKDYMRLRAPLTDELAAIEREVHRIREHALSIERGDDALHRLAWLRQQLELSAV